MPPGLQSDSAAVTAMQDLSTWAQTGSLLIGDGHSSISGVEYSRMRAGHADNVTIPQLFACEHFTLKFDSLINDSGGDFTGEFDFETVSSAQVQYDEATNAIDGNAPITYNEVTKL